MTPIPNTSGEENGRISKASGGSKSSHNQVDKPVEPAKALEQINNESRWQVGSMYVGSSKIKNYTLDALLLDLDELQNKPRRLFDTIALIAFYHIKDGAQKEYVMDGINQWRAAVDNGVYGSVIELAELKRQHQGNDMIKNSLNQGLTTQVAGQLDTKISLQGAAPVKIAPESPETPSTNTLEEILISLGLKGYTIDWDETLAKLTQYKNEAVIAELNLLKSHTYKDDTFWPEIDDRIAKLRSDNG